MATNEREFIAAKDLPVTEAEEVNVLVVDPTTGELAQKAGANLGGGSTKADLVIRINNHAMFASTENISIISGSVEAVCTAINNGVIPVVEVEIVVMGDWSKEANKYLAKTIIYGDNLYVDFVYCGAYREKYSCRIVYDLINDYNLSEFVKETIAITE